MLRSLNEKIHKICIILLMLILGCFQILKRQKFERNQTVINCDENLCFLCEDESELYMPTIVFITSVLAYTIIILGLLHVYSEIKYGRFISTRTIYPDIIYEIDEYTTIWGRILVSLTHNNSEHNIHVSPAVMQTIYPEIKQTLCTYIIQLPSDVDCKKLAFGSIIYHGNKKTINDG